jgi:hypothetical protein
MLSVCVTLSVSDVHLCNCIVQNTLHFAICIMLFCIAFNQFNNIYQFTVQHCNCGFTNTEISNIFVFFPSVSQYCFQVPTSVSVSLFQNIRYRFGFSVYRPMTNLNSNWSYWPCLDFNFQRTKQYSHPSNRLIMTTERWNKWQAVNDKHQTFELGTPLLWLWMIHLVLFKIFVPPLLTMTDVGFGWVSFPTSAPSLLIDWMSAFAARTASDNESEETYVNCLDDWKRKTFFNLLDWIGCHKLQQNIDCKRSKKDPFCEKIA